jgi:hypothetical protein
MRFSHHRGGWPKGGYPMESTALASRDMGGALRSGPQGYEVHPNTKNIYPYNIKKAFF